MRILIIHILLLFSFLHASSQDVKKIVAEAEKLEILLNESAALTKYSEVVKLQPTNIAATLKCSELSVRIGARQPDGKKKNDYYTLAKKYVELALKLDSNNSDANAVMAMVIGQMCLSSTNKEKLSASKDIRKYVDLSLKADPNNYKAWHILGKWHAELSDLNMFEKAAIKIFYGELPEASLSESIAAFEKSHNFSGGFVLNYLELAKAYKRNNETKRAIAMLQKMQLATNYTADDTALKEMGKKLLKEWQ